MKPILSICIPNYNRPEYLYKNLRAIGMQVEETTAVEVVVVDDRSKEKVDAVIEKIRSEYPELVLRYYKNRKNLGFDLNVLRCVSLALGKYCWLISNDDMIKPGGVERILSEIGKTKDVVLFLINYERFDKLLNSITAVRMVSLKKDLSFVDKNKFWFMETDGSYFKALGVNTLTMSCNVFEKKAWDKSVVKANGFVGHNFIHVFVLAGAIGKGKMKFLAAPLIRYLANNHRTWPNDIWKDYNTVLMSYLVSLGFDEKAVDRLRLRQKEYEKREGMTKNKLIVTVYRWLYPIYHRVFGRVS